MTTVLSVEHLRKRYGDDIALHDVSFAVERGEIFGILGPNGAGKTTTVECAQGLRQPDGGEISVLGLSYRSDAAAIRARIGCPLQSSALPDRMTVREALELFAAFAPRPTDWRVLLNEWGLAGRERTAFAGLSGGLQQRLFIALALIGRPDLIFLDEMTQGLDPVARRTTWELIRAVREQGTTVVLVTHFLDEAHALCDRLAVIDQGRVVATGTPGDLIAASDRSTTVRFSSDAPDLGWLRDVAHVSAVTRHGHHVAVIGDGPVLPLVAAALVNHGIVPNDLTAQSATLEQVYLDLTSANEGIAA